MRWLFSCAIHDRLLVNKVFKQTTELPDILGDFNKSQFGVSITLILIINYFDPLGTFPYVENYVGNQTRFEGVDFLQFTFTNSW